MKFTYITFILASYGYSALAAPTYLTRRHEEENGKQAQLLNAAFDELSSADRCAQAPFDVGSKACINGSIAVCSTEGDWEVQGPCPNAGETCLAVPLTNGHGTDVQCISIAQAEKLIDSTGVDGGLKGDGTTDLPSESTCTESPEATETGDATVNPPQISIGLGDDFEPSEPTPTDSESSVDDAVPTPEPTGTIEEDGGQGKGKGQVTVTVTVSESPSEEVSETITVTETLGATPTEEVGGGNPTSDFVKPTEFSPIPISSTTTTTEAEALPTDSASSVEVTESADAIETSLSASPTDTFITSIVGSAVDVPQATTTTPAAKPSIPPLVDPSASAPPAPAPTAPSAIVPDIQPIEGISFIPLEQSGSEGEIVGDDGDAKDPEEDSGYYY